MRANQSPFTNLSIYDKYFLEELCNDYLFPDLTNPKLEIVQKLQEIFIDCMNSEMSRTPITFPVVTACFAIDENDNILDLEFAEFVSKKDLLYGFINVYNGTTATLSSCCRMRSNKLKEVANEYFNSFGAGSSKIGSLGVCSINFPRLALVSKTHEEYFERLIELVDICQMINQAKRLITKDRIENGNLPLYTYGFMELNKQYGTIGVNGLNEAVMLSGYDILKPAGQEFALTTIAEINKRNDYWSEVYGCPTNCEQVPGETMSIKMAKKDKILGFDTGFDIYSNQFIPLITKADMLDRITLQGKFDKHFSGGSILHLNVDTRIERWEDIRDLIVSCAKQGVVYWAINYNIQQCEDGHMTVGKGEHCSVCGKLIENNFTRVVGFLTNTKNWHKVRREQDYPNRQWYQI